MGVRVRVRVRVSAPGRSRRARSHQSRLRGGAGHVSAYHAISPLYLRCIPAVSPARRRRPRSSAIGYCCSSPPGQGSRSSGALVPWISTAPNTLYARLSSGTTTRTVCRSAPAAAPRATALAACSTISSGDCGTRGSRAVGSATIVGGCRTRPTRVGAQGASATCHRPTTSILEDASADPRARCPRSASGGGGIDRTSREDASALLASFG